MISMDRPTSGHDLIFFPYFSSILFFFVSCCFLFPLFFFLEIPKLHNHRDMHEERIESNRTRGKGNKGKGEQGNKQTSIYCMRWGLFMGVVFFFLPPQERHLVCFVDDDDDDEARRQSDLSTFLDLIFGSSALGMKKRRTCECGGVW